MSCLKRIILCITTLLYRCFPQPENLQCTSFTHHVYFTGYDGLHSRRLNHTACRYFPFIINSPLCPGQSHLAPVELIFGDSADATCSGDVVRGLQGPLRNKTRNGECCQVNNNDKVQRYCLPSKKEQVPGRYHDLLRQCSRGVRCVFGTGNSHLDDSFLSTDYMSLEYDCVDGKKYFYTYFFNKSCKK